MEEDLRCYFFVRSEEVAISFLRRILYIHKSDVHVLFTDRRINFVYS